jgi:hypothetical protein
MLLTHTHSHSLTLLLTQTSAQELEGYLDALTQQSGVASREDLRAALVAIVGQQPADADLDCLFADADVDENGALCVL